jgi:hypothetical protein
MLDFHLSTSVDSTVPPERWIASLSNGETIHENIVHGAPPAWERLRLYVMDKAVSITCLRLLIAGTEVKLPRGAEGYLQKKIAWTNLKQSGVKKCIGYTQGGRALIYEVSSDRDSVTKRTVDPGDPFTIYRKDIRDAKKLSVLPS